jgi:hypothetical protein
VRYRSAGVNSSVARAYAFLQTPRLAERAPRPLRQRLRAPSCRENGVPEPPANLRTSGLLSIGPPSDPATAFVIAYCADRIQSKGEASLDGRAVWRFVSRPSAHGSDQEWLVDRESWLPVRYGYVEHNQQAGQRYTARLTVRFLDFEVLPLKAGTRHLLHLTAAQRTVCRAAKAQELARARKHLSPRLYRRVAPGIRRRDNCR